MSTPLACKQASLLLQRDMSRGVPKGPAPLYGGEERGRFDIRCIQGYDIETHGGPFSSTATEISATSLASCRQRPWRNSQLSARRGTRTCCQNLLC